MKKEIIELLETPSWGPSNTKFCRAETTLIRDDDAILRWYNEDGTFEEQSLNQLIWYYLNM